MDLQQRKLNKAEWESIEIPVGAEEQEVLQVIMKGYHDVNLCYNKTDSLFTYLKIEVSAEMEDYLFSRYYAARVVAMLQKHKITFLAVHVSSNPTIKKADLIRLQKNTQELIDAAPLFENVLLDVLEQLFKHKNKASKDSKDKAPALWLKHYYTLHKLIKYHVKHVNAHIVHSVKKTLDEWEADVDIAALIQNAPECIEKNETLTKYGDRMLYEHQKEIFTVFKAKATEAKATEANATEAKEAGDNKPGKLVLYIAPTGTGKTLSPLGLSETHRVIFVCAARHVGLALARAAISCNKKVAFAFGCASAGDIRLHYFAAKEITKNRRTGGIWKVDNSVGDKVEIMICDIKSYLPAMYYMMAFNAADEIITYWDEPTITMDYAEHEFHEIIHKNWAENKIPNMVLSSATLPKLHELTETVADFKERFPGATICNIVSHDCKKSIPLIDKNGYVVLPHWLDPDYNQVRAAVRFCEDNKTLLRYFELNGIIEFINVLLDRGFIPRQHTIERQFAGLEDVTIINIKLYYLRLLKNLDPAVWPALSAHLHLIRRQKIAENGAVDVKGHRLVKSVSLGPGVPSQATDKPLARMASMPYPLETPPLVPKTGGNCAIYVSTKDAFTLTEGPTIFLANDVEKVAKFCIQQANIPAIVMENIVEKITYNNTVNARIEEIEKTIEDSRSKKEEEYKSKAGSNNQEGGKKKLHKLERDTGEPQQGVNKKSLAELDMLRSMIKVCKLNDAFVPNTLEHLNKWTDVVQIAAHTKNNVPFKSDIEDETIVKIMMLKNVADSWKILLLMGIGVFTTHESIEYTEIMKNLADHQKLYLIIASSDYIYGTNYPFCHAYLSKDLNLTQEKIIQAMGRVGRNKIQQDYTIRFRDDEQIRKIFLDDAEKPEVANMNRLFASVV